MGPLLAIVGLLWATGAPGVDPTLLPAWEALGAIRGREGAEVGEMLRVQSAGTVTAIVAAPLASADVTWEPVGRRIVVDEELLGEDPKLVAAAIVYGVARAEWDRQARARPDLGPVDCLGREVGARQDQARVWALAWSEGEMPRRTTAESRLTDLADLELAEPRTAIERWIREQDGWWLTCGGTNAQLPGAVVLSRRVMCIDRGEQAQRLGQTGVDGGRGQEDGQEDGGHGASVARGATCYPDQERGSRMRRGACQAVDPAYGAAVKVGASGRRSGRMA